MTTDTSGDGTSRSIGEILDDLRGDFPDISVSKIRFLESQGLITPERSPSGYRQFTDTDLELLRWILRQQRDHYLPLKVIRRRLKEGDGPGREVDLGGSGTSPGDTATSTSTSTTAQSQTPARVAAASVAVDEARLKLPDPPPATEDDVWLVSDGPDPATASVPAAPADELWPAGGEARYSRNDLRQQAGLDERAMSELESFGLLPAAGPEGYGPEALRIAQACAGFFTYGVEARHLKMYKRFAEQEAAILNQVVPGASAKDPGAAAKAAEALTDLARLGTALRLSMLRVGVGPRPGGMIAG
ncbi:MAG TPA: MerR family transcriptional regulator [Acidimicrobiia bacterium]|nr:MerR family transcriptional regulator [Acidimicrobiia bacterium]